MFAWQSTYRYLTVDDKLTYFSRFSLPHDDDKVKCKEFKDQKLGLFHVMSPTLDYSTNPWLWSVCSKNLMTEFLEWVAVVIRLDPNVLFSKLNLLGAYPRQDVAAQMSLRNWCLSSATLLAAAIVPNVSVMSFSHLCRGFPLLLFPATISWIIVFSKPLWRVTWPKYLKFWRLTKLYSQFVGRLS